MLLLRRTPAIGFGVAIVLAGVATILMVESRSTVTSYLISNVCGTLPASAFVLCWLAAVLAGVSVLLSVVGIYWLRQEEGRLPPYALLVGMLCLFATILTMMTVVQVHDAASC